MRTTHTLTPFVILGIIFSATLSGCAELPVQMSQDNRAQCERTARIAPALTSKRWSAIRTAREEHSDFNGHLINKAGQLTRFGMTESETTDSEAPIQPASRIAWMNVKRYWDTLDTQLAARKAQDPESATGVRQPALHQLRSVQPLPGKQPGAAEVEIQSDIPLEIERALARSADLTPRQRQALTQSLYRAAINDVPWSASFISYLMFQAGYALNEFEFSASHIDYIRKAFAVTWLEATGQRPSLDPDLAGYRFRACDARLTAPRPGDLLCHMRGTPQASNTFSRIDALLSTDPARTFYPAHCELVTAIDSVQRQLTSIGGNVMQSVAQRTLRLDKNGLVADCPQGSRCAASVDPRQWSILLQHLED